MEDYTETLIELNTKLERLLNGVETLSQNQERMCDDVGKIKDAVYNPDEGLYARLRNLEQWKENQSKVQWILITGILMLAAKQIWETVIVQ